MADNVALMEAFVPWANSQPWIERYFWNQAVSVLTSLRCSCCYLATRHVMKLLCLGLSSPALDRALLLEPSCECADLSALFILLSGHVTCHKAVSVLTSLGSSRSKVSLPIHSLSKLPTRAYYVLYGVDYHSPLWLCGKAHVMKLLCLGSSSSLALKVCFWISTASLLSSLSLMLPVSSKSGQRSVCSWTNSQMYFKGCVCVVQTPAEGTDANIQYSYLVNKSVDGSGDGSLSVLGQTYANFPC